jgi:uncharacterized protein YfaS (alpha-2-macroglobulin family)
MKILVLLSSLFLSSVAFSSNLEYAGKLFKDGSYKEATAVYGNLEKSLEGDEKEIAAYRLIESLALQGKLEDAYKKVLTHKGSNSAKWKSLFLLLRADLSGFYYNRTRYNNSTPIKGKRISFTKYNNDQWKLETLGTYLKIWKMSKSIAKMGIKDTHSLIQTKDRDTDRIKTLFDYYTHKFSAFLKVIGANDYKMRTQLKKVSELRKALDSRTSPDLKGKPERSLLKVLSHGQSYNHGRSEASQLWAAEIVQIAIDGVSDYSGKAELKKLESFIRKSKIFKVSERLKDLAIGLRAKVYKKLSDSYTEKGSLDKVVSLCERLVQSKRKTIGRDICFSLYTEVTFPELELSTKFTNDNLSEPINIFVRNIETVYFKVFEVPTNDVLNSYNNRQNSLFENLRRSRSDKDFYKRFEVVDEFNFSPKYKERYKRQNFKISNKKKLKPGIYYIVASKDEKFEEKSSSLLTGTYLSIGDIVVIGSAGYQQTEENFYRNFYKDGRVNGPVVNSFVFNGIDGSAIAGAEVFGLIRKQRAKDYQNYVRTTNEIGLTQYSTGILKPKDDYIYYDLIARNGVSFSYLRYEDYFASRTKPRVLVFSEVDRPIYRPGQKLLVKIYGFEHTPNSYVPFDSSKDIKVIFSDANGEKIEERSVKLNSFGSASLDFEIPTGRALGSYSLRISTKAYSESFSAYRAVRVEEYKRPEFEVLIDEGKGQWEFGKKASITGRAKYYFGGTVPGAKITYRVYEQIFRPYWGFYFGGSSRSEVLSGNVKTDKSGEFKIPFVPKKSNESKQYTVEIEARDTGGRTIKASKSFLVSTQKFFVGFNSKQGFFTTDDDVQVEVKLSNINGQPVSALGEMKLEKLIEDNKPIHNNWQQLLLNWKKTASVKSENIKIGAMGARDVHLGNLSPGAYRLNLTFKGGIKSSYPFIVSSKNGDLGGWQFKNIVLVQKKNYKPGQKLRILYGDNRLDKGKWFQLWYGDFLVDQNFEKKAKISLYEFDLKDHHQGGLNFRYFGIDNFEVLQGTTSIPIDWTTKKLKVVLKHSKKFEPGKKANFQVEVKDHTGKLIQTEFSISSFDKSLEYYQKHGQPWVNRVYGNTQYSRDIRAAALNSGGHNIIRKLQLYEVLRRSKSRFKSKLLPSSYFAELSNPRRSRRQQRGYFSEGAEEADSFVASAPMDDKEMSANLIGAQRARKKSKARPKKEAKTQADASPEEPESEATEVSPRSDFRETAFFHRQGLASKGKGRFSANVPERLTTWKNRAIAHTRDLKLGVAETEYVTQKDVMIRVEVPRFVRELDKVRISLLIDKLIEKKVSGKAQIKVEINGRSVTKSLSVPATKEFNLDKNQQIALNWQLDIPAELGDLKVSASFKAGKYKDAEVKSIPILPARERVVDSIMAFFSGDESKTLKLNALKNAKGNFVESLHLSIEPQLATNLLQAIHSLINYPYECTEQLLNKFVPLSAVKSLFDGNPELSKVMETKEDRNTILPPWEKSDPRRLVEMIETPWVQASKGYSARSVMGLFKPSRVEKNFKRVSAELKSRQLSNGAFVWFPGGREDLYITLYVLDSLAMAQLYGYQVDRNIVQKAFRFVFSELDKMNDWAKKNNLRDQSLSLYSAYIVSAYPKSWTASYKGWSRALKVLKQAKKKYVSLSKYSKAMSALALFRLGDKETGEQWIRTLIKNSEYDVLVGRHWAPDPQSWLWYSDTVERHAFILRALSEMKIDQKSSGELVQWLLFNKKGNEWKSTKTSAAAITAMIYYLKSINALSGEQIYKVDWSGEKKNFKIANLSASTEKRYEWSIAGAKAKKKTPVIKIQKKGPGLAFASLTRIASVVDIDEGSSQGPLQMRRTFYRKIKKKKGFELEELKKGSSVKVGDVIVSELKIKAASELEYVHLKDPRGAGFESELLKSGWNWSRISRNGWSGLSHYQEPRDSLMNFFMSYIPKGRYRFRHELRAVTPGVFSLGPARIQSMYSPDFGAFTSSFKILVKP